MKTNLLDTTFIIPVTIEHTDRMENVMMVTKFLNLHFDTNILIGEVNTDSIVDAVHYDMPTFHRTKVINDLTRLVKTPYVINWDADVLVQPSQIAAMVEMLRAGVDVVYPYDGTFYMVDRKHKPTNLNTLDSLAICPRQRVGARGYNDDSFGGAVGYNVESFWKAGGENENLVNYGHDDQERWRRFNLLLKVSRVPGPLYHINHHRGVNSTFKHENGRANQIYWDKLCRMNDEQFIEHIKTFTWLK